MATFHDPVFPMGPSLGESIILELTEEDRKRYLDPIAVTVAGFLDFSDYSRVYTDLYLKLTMGFFYRTGETPEFVYDIAQVWAEGVAALYENVS